MSYQNKTKDQLIAEIDKILNKLYIGPRSKKNFIGKRLYNYINDTLGKKRIRLDEIQGLYSYLSTIKDVYLLEYKESNETDKKKLEVMKKSQEINKSKKKLIEEVKDPYFKKDKYKRIINIFKPTKEQNYYNEGVPYRTENQALNVKNIQFRIKNKNASYDDKIEQLKETIKYLVFDKYKNKEFLVDIVYFQDAKEVFDTRNKNEVIISINSTQDNAFDIMNKLNKRIYWSDEYSIKSDESFGVNYLINPDRFYLIMFERKSGGCRSNKKFITNDNCITYSYKSTNENCLLEILRDTFNIKDTSNKIREKLGFQKNEKLNVSHIKRLETIYHIQIIVYLDEIIFDLDEIDEKKLFVFYSGNDKFQDRNVQILLKDNHYSKLINLNFNTKEIEKQKFFKNKIDDYEFVFFDYETVNSDTKLNPYYICIKTKDRIYNVPDKKEDIENFNFDDFNFYVDNILNEIYNTYDKKLLLIGYNSSRFDNFIIFDELLKNEITPNLLYVNNSILTLETKNIKTFDLCRFVMSSLKEACNNFKLKNKKIDGFDHTIPQYEFIKGNLKGWMIENYDDLKKYCDMDVLALEELFFTLKDKILELTNDKLDIINYPTLSSSAKDFWLSNYSFKKDHYNNNDYNFNLPIITNETIQNVSGDAVYLYDFIRQSLTAGRSEMFKICKTDELIKVIDVKSLYPFVMEGGNEQLKYKCEYPAGDIVYTDEYVENKLGFYYCDILEQPEKNIIPLRTKGHPLNWKHKGVIKNISLCSVDIELIRKYGKIEIHNGIYFTEKSDKVFIDYIQFFKNEKNRQDELKKNKDQNYNPSLRSISKLYLNSLSGKTIENLHCDEFILSKDNDKLCKKINKLKSFNHYEERNNFFMLKGTKEYESVLKKNKVPHYLGVFIYAYARKWMYENVIYEYFGYGMDTDSYFMPDEEFQKLYNDKKYLFGDLFGQFEIENFEDGKNKKWNDCYFIAPKVYALYEEGKPEYSKTRFKGLKHNDRILTEPQYNEFIKIKNENEKFDFYEKLERVGSDGYINKKIFEMLSAKEKKKIYIVSNMLNKNNLSIKNIYIVKKFNEDKKVKLKKVL
jgi:hypothetical protein